MDHYIIFFFPWKLGAFYLITSSLAFISLHNDNESIYTASRKVNVNVILLFLKLARKWIKPEK